MVRKFGRLFNSSCAFAFTLLVQLGNVSALTAFLFTHGLYCMTQYT